MKLPPTDSPSLGITHPEPAECLPLYSSTATEWKGGLTTEEYIEESFNLASSRDSRHSHADWILVDLNLPADERQILSSCETFRKRALLCEPGEGIEEVVVYGIASVFTAPEYRRHGYATRMLKEIAATYVKPHCAATILFSDIGKKFYSELGWHPLPGNSHLKFPAAPGPAEARPLFESDLGELCKEDETMIREAMSSRVQDGKTRMMMIPDHGQMLWHHVREEFVCRKVLGKSPKVKGAVAGKPGSRVWAVWTHKFDGKPEDLEAGSTLYILRLVIEKQGPEGTVSTKDRDDVKRNLKAVIQSAQAEAMEWNLQSVTLWGPRLPTRELIQEIGIQFSDVQRENDGIASLMLTEGGSKENELEWLGNERYAWL